MKIRVGIIGAGPGGLAAAVLLARRGFDVTVFERDSRVGGRNGRIRADGYTFDIGPTFFTMPFLLDEIFQECGRRLDDYIDLKAVEPHYRLVFTDGKEFRPGKDADGVRDSIRAINPADADGFDRYMEYNRRKLAAVLPSLKVPHEHVYQILRPALFKTLPFLNVAGSAWGEASRFFSDERIRLAFTFESRYFGMSPFQTPSLFTILPYSEYRWGVHHPVGGCHRLSMALEQLARDMGARIHLDADVTQIETEGRRARILHTADDRVHKFDEIVMNADFAWGMRNLVPDAARRHYTDEKLARKKYSGSAFVMHLGLDKRYEHLLHHNIFISDDYRKSLRGNEPGERLSEDPSIYVQNASATDPTLAPEGHSTLRVSVSVPNLKTGIDWSKERDRYRRLVLDKLAERAGLADLEKHIRFEQIITPADWESRMRVGYGAIFSLEHTWRQIYALRPHNRFEEFENMWLVGGGTQPGSGLPFIYASARITADGIAKKYSGRPEPSPLAAPIPRISAAGAPT